jgi:hypothetical protein
VELWWLRTNFGYFWSFDWVWVWFKEPSLTILHESIPITKPDSGPYLKSWTQTQPEENQGWVHPRLEVLDPLQHTCSSPNGMLLSMQQETRPYVNGFPLGCCITMHTVRSCDVSSHMKETILLWGHLSIK